MTGRPLVLSSSALLLVVLMSVAGYTNGSCPDGWSYYSSRDTCNVFFNCRINQTDADFICSAMNGFLAVARDRREGKFLWNLSQRQSKVWLGLRDVSDNSSPPFWQWVTDDDFSWAAWNTRGDEPQLPHRCAVISHNRWETRDCGNFAAFACSRPATTAQPPLVTDTTLPWVSSASAIHRPDDDTETDDNDVIQDGGSGDL